MPHNLLEIKIGKYMKRNLILFSIIVILSFIILRWIDTWPSNSFVESIAQGVFDLRGAVLDFLFRIAPLVITVVVAISSLTVNSYTGTFLDFLLEDKTIKSLLIFTFAFTCYHLLVVFFVGIPSQGTESFLIENFTTFLGDLIFGGLYSIYVCIAAMHIFLYCSPGTLKRKFLTDIKKSMRNINKEIHFANTKELNNINVYQLNNQIGLFTNLLMRSIKSKDYKDIDSTIRDISDIWREFVEYTENDKLKKSVNEYFYTKLAEISQSEMDNQKKSKLKFKSVYKLDHSKTYKIDVKIPTNQKYVLKSKVFPETDLKIGFEMIPTLESKSKEKQKIFEDCVNKIGQVFVDCFDIGFSQGEYFVCDEILKSLYGISKAKDIQNEDVEKLFKIYNEIFEVTMRHDKKSQTTKYINLILDYVNKIYKQHSKNIKDCDVYYQFLVNAVNLNDAKIAKNILIKFNEILSKDLVDYKDAIIQLKKILVYSLKYKKMKCFAELIRFTVVSQLKLDTINEVLAEGIIFDENLEDFQRLLDKLATPMDEQGVNYRKENYYSVKLYIIWFSYYCLQKRISPKRIDEEYHNLEIPQNIIYNVPFETIRTILLDVETHLENWRKLFVTQEKYYFIENTYALLRPDHRELFDKEVSEYGETTMLNEMIELTRSRG